MSTRSFDLAGLDGANPLGFLAALGTLVTLNRRGETRVRLRWKRVHTWVPVLEGVSSPGKAELADSLADALRGRRVSPDAEQRRAAAQKAMEAAKTAIKKKREEIRKRGLSRSERAEVLERELRPLEQDYHQKRERWLEALRQAVSRPELALGKRIDCKPEEYREYAADFLTGAGHADREALDLLAAFGNDACCEQRSEAIEATPFCFTTGSGHQFFLETVRKLIDQVTAERVQMVLFHPWEYRDPRFSMRWDPVEDKRYALLDSDPGPTGARTVWMANLLAYRALTLFPAAPTRRGLAAAGWNLEEDPPTFTWPLWEFAATLDSIRTLIRLPELTRKRPDRSLLRARGISAVYRAQRVEVGRGSNRKLNFTPAREVGGRGD
jgi:hypothetical protein